MDFRLYMDFRQALDHQGPNIVPIQEAEYRATGHVEATRRYAPSSTATSEVDQPLHLIYPVEHLLRRYSHPYERNSGAREEIMAVKASRQLIQWYPLLTSRWQ